MNGFDLLSEMSLIDEEYVHEALEDVPAIKKPHYWYKFVAAAACFAVIMVVAFPFLSSLPTGEPPSGPDITVGNPQADDSPSNQPAELPQESPNTTDDSPQASDPHDKQTTITINMADVVPNKVTDILDASRLQLDPASCSAVTWNRNDFIKYYDSDLIPAYIPSGLLAGPTNKTATVYASNNDGTIVEDTVTLYYYHDYYEDGSPKITDDLPLRKGFSVSISKLGLLNECVYDASESELKTTNINGVEVIFGCCSVSYGPYDPETHEPAGYCDIYTSEFVCNGIEYQIFAEQMELDEVAKVTASIITGEKEIFVSG